jgi:anion-transporting  ArsA/GET3 family ATPase
LKSLLIDFIETYTALALNYKKFKDVVESNVLMPEKQVINELKELKRAHR